jgi:hypothetical protein
MLLFPPHKPNIILDRDIIGWMQLTRIDGEGKPDDWFVGIIFQTLDGVIYRREHNIKL